MACHFLIEKSKKKTGKTETITPFTDQTFAAPLDLNPLATPVQRDSCRIGRYFIQYTVASRDMYLTTYIYSTRMIHSKLVIVVHLSCLLLYCTLVYYLCIAQYNLDYQNTLVVRMVKSVRISEILQITEIILNQ